ncbi:MAG: 16S rRNA (guanine(527)-N(7))-methyltransferase RsmG [Bradymonadaceae bacterium]|nr:16S rRNA (guanine(527)-N(7))-methyltransferase RsmG [Lujinxingiaceae bacterium]
MIEAIESFCHAQRLPFDNRTGERFTTYLALLQRFNEGSNLIGPLSAQAIVDDLLIDSLRAGVAARPVGHMLDVGTGAGLPGIALRIVFDDCALTLVEPRRKRATFLKIVATRLGLSGVTIENKRIEELTAARYDYVVSKAFQPPLEWLETASAWVQPEGTIVCMTRPHALEGLQQRAGELGFTLVGQCASSSSDGEDRAVYAFRAPLR